LDPSYLAVCIEGVATPSELDDLYAEFRRIYP
jgi:hypothetical protein